MDREKIIQDFIDLLEAQETDEDRLEIIYQIKKFICIHCGAFGHGECYCMRDD